MAEDGETAADGAALELFRRFAEAVRDGEFLRGQRSACAHLVEVLGLDSSSELKWQFEREEAARALDAAIPQMVQAGLLLFPRRLPTYHWLWMIRRLPLTFNWRAYAVPNVRELLQSIVCAPDVQAGAELAGGLLRITPRHARSLAFAVGFAEVLDSAVAAYRWTGKGGGFSVTPRKAEILPVGPDLLMTRLRLYDSRVQKDGGIGTFGIIVPRVEHEVQSLEFPTAFGFALTRAVPRWTDDPPLPTSRLHRFIIQQDSLDELLELAGELARVEGYEWPEEVGALLVLSVAMSQLMAEKPLVKSSILEVGYSVHSYGPHEPDGALHQALSHALDWTTERLPSQMVPRSMESVVASLRALIPSVRPRRAGPVVITLEDGSAIVDWHAATSRLLSILRYPPLQAEAANRRGRAFEKGLQDRIRRTSCAPVAWLSDLVGRHLKQSGESRAFGEIDAAASIPESNIHLLISCKSVPMSDAYERGEYQVVRNVSTALEKALMEARDLARSLMVHRTGSNYDIPADALLVPLVATPRPMWIDDEEAWDFPLGEDFGVRAVTGAGELLWALGSVSVDGLTA